MLADFGRLETILASRPAASLDAGFASRVLSRMHADQQGFAQAALFPARRFAMRTVLKLAASLALCAGGFAFWWRTREHGELRVASAAQSIEAKAIDQALDWFAHTQEKSGAWDATKWQGNKQYEVGLTGVALLAFMKHAETGGKDAYAGVVRRAIDYLVRQQDAQGAIGPACSGRMYNHGIATVALLEAYRKTGSGTLREPIARAVGYILDQQLDSGGWGYERSAGQQANTSISFWQLQALELAHTAKFGDSEAACRRGLRWLSGVIDGNGLVGYESRGDFPHGSDTLTAMGAVCLGTARRSADGASQEAGRVHRALQSVAAKIDPQADFYRCFFLARAASMTGDPRYDQPLARLRQSLVAVRSTAADAAGSWEPVGAWSSEGGRIFSTAMATLSLQTSREDANVL